MFSDESNKLEKYKYVRTKWILKNRKYKSLRGPTHFEGRVFANGLGDMGSIPGRVIPKILKMVLDASLLKTQQYREWIKGKVEQYRNRSRDLPYTSV